MDQVLELSYALDTFYFLVCGALVMWMAAGFTMLESGLVRAKNTAEILTKNVGLYSIACIMYMLCGYGIMYGDGNGVIPGISMLTAADNDVADVIAAWVTTRPTTRHCLTSSSRWCSSPPRCRSCPAQWPSA